MNSYERTEKIRQAEELREYLDTEPVSDSVDQRLREIYNQLPEKLPSAKPKKNRLIRAAFGSVGTAAAMLVLMVGINAANPAFAEELPLLGGLFKKINSSTFYAETVDTERIDKNAVSIPVTEAENAVVENELYKITVEKLYYDGRFLHSVLEMETDLNPRSDELSFSGRLMLNGEAANVLDDQDMNLLPYIEWMNTGKDSYMAEIKFAVPQKYRDSEELRVEYSLMLSDMESSPGEPDQQQAALMENAGEEKESILNREPPRLDEGMENCLKFTAVPNKEDAVFFDADCKNSGAELYSFYTSPAGTEIFMNVPIEGDKGTYAQLFTVDGKEIGDINHQNMAFPEKAETESMEKYFHFDGIKEEYEQVILRLSASNGNDDNTEYRIIEYLIDLDSQSAAPSELHSDKNSPLYYNEELQWITPQISPAYRASDQELREAEGYKLEYLSSGGVYKSVYLTFVTPEDYRELRVEMHVNGELRHTEITQRDGDTNSFMPLSEYEYDPMNIAFNEDGSMWIHDSGYFERDEDVKAGLNIQKLTMGQRFFQMDDAAEIKIFDSETGELLHKESQSLTLPEGVEIGENQQLYKVPSRFYYVVGGTN